MAFLAGSKGQNITAEQNNKTSLKNNNEGFIFMTVDLCQSEKSGVAGRSIISLVCSR